MKSLDHLRALRALAMAQLMQHDPSRQIKIPGPPLDLSEPTEQELVVQIRAKKRLACNHLV